MTQESRVNNNSRFDWQINIFLMKKWTGTISPSEADLFITASCTLNVWIWKGYAESVGNLLRNHITTIFVMSLCSVKTVMLMNELHFQTNCLAKHWCVTPIKACKLILSPDRYNSSQILPIHLSFKDINKYWNTYDAGYNNFLQI